MIWQFRPWLAKRCAVQFARSRLMRRRRIATGRSVRNGAGWWTSAPGRVRTIAYRAPRSKIASIRTTSRTRRRYFTEAAAERTERGAERNNRKWERGGRTKAQDFTHEVGLQINIRDHGA